MHQKEKKQTRRPAQTSGGAAAVDPDVTETFIVPLSSVTADSPGV